MDNTVIRPGETAEVLCDGTGRVGPLSYLVPEGVEVRPGDAVHAPFGARELVGVVLGRGDTSKATRELVLRYGRRSRPEVIDAMRRVAHHHATTFESMARRLAPSTGKGSEPADAGPAQLASDLPAPTGWSKVPPHLRKKVLLRAPLVDPATLAAREAVKLASQHGGQVLVLCPTVAMVSRVTQAFASGAMRMDRGADHGAWKGFVEGSVTVGVGTRAAAWYAAAELVGIVVVEADHPGHLEPAQPRVHSLEVARVRAEHEDVTVAAITARPEPMTLAGGMKVRSVGDRGDWPTTELFDRSTLPPGDRAFPPTLRARVERACDRGDRVIVLAESRPTRRRCTQCHQPRPCQRCREADVGEGSCAHQPDDPCGTCGSTTTWLSGWDAERISHWVPGSAKVVTLGQLQRLRAGELVVCLDIDAALRRPSFDPEQPASQVLLALTQATRADGALVIGTSQPDHPLLQDLVVKKDQLSAARRMWATAKDLAMPPFGATVTLWLGWDRPPRPDRWPGRVLGPRRRDGGWEMVVHVRADDWPTLREQLERTRRRGKVRAEVVAPLP